LRVDFRFLLIDVTHGPIWMAHVWPMSAGARVECHIAS
jgi:hypothetical protein